MPSWCTQGKILNLVCRNYWIATPVYNLFVVYLAKLSAYKFILRRTIWRRSIHFIGNVKATGHIFVVRGGAFGFRSATSRKNVGSIHNRVIGIFHWLNPSGRTIALVSAQPLTEMSTRNSSWGEEAVGAYGWQRYHVHMPINCLEVLGASPF